MDYKYDALGRMLMRDETGGDITINYWLGLTLLAQENSDYGVSAFRPWVEAHATPDSDGWAPAAGGSGTQSYVYTGDADRGTVLHLSTSGSGNLDAKFIIGDQHGANLNSNGTDWGKADRRVLAFWAKNANTGHAYQLTVYERVSGVNYTLILNSGTGTPSFGTNTATLFLGNSDSTLNDGAWHYVETEISVGLIDGILWEGKNLYLDDPALSDGVLQRSYAVIPGAAINEALGSWTGDNVTWDNSIQARWFQYNDLGTVMAQTKADGTAEGAWEPDFYGNYVNRYALSGSPGRPELGLTGKQYDASTGMYNHGFRWLDFERGRWMSVEPLGIDAPNLYHFVFSDPVNLIDSNGLQSDYPDWWNPADWFRYGFGDPFAKNFDGFGGKLDARTASAAAAGLENPGRIYGGGSYTQARADIRDLGGEVTMQAAMLPFAEIGKAGEEAACPRIAKNTTRFASALGTAEYRVPDFIIENMMIEVKTVKRLYATQQLRDYIAIARRDGKVLKLIVDVNTKIMPSLRALIDQGLIILEPPKALITPNSK